MALFNKELGKILQHYKKNQSKALIHMFDIHALITNIISFTAFTYLS
jgi:hypothetical protein